MALPPLATPADATRYGYENVSEAMLARASARVRRYTGMQITAGTSTVVLSGPGPWRMPQRPVTGITSVTDEHGNPTAYKLEGQFLAATRCPLTVTYSHGYEELPDALVELVCAIASRMENMPTSVGAGVQTEQAGSETVTWGSQAFASTSGLLPSEEAALDRMFPTLPRTVWLV